MTLLRQHLLYLCVCVCGCVRVCVCLCVCWGVGVGRKKNPSQRRPFLLLFFARYASNGQNRAKKQDFTAAHLRV